MIELWGLTGGIGAGKSAVARILAEAGIPVLDADQIARELSEPGGAAHAQIVQRFGTAERAKLRQIVFADPAVRGELEAILHPLIRQVSRQRAAELGTQWLANHPGATRAIVIYEAALLVEAGRDLDLQGLIVVEAPLEIRKTRVVARSALSPEAVAAVAATQATDEERRAHATLLIENSGTPAELREKVTRIARERGWT